MQLERLAVTTAYAAEIHAPLFSTDPDATIRYWAVAFGVSYFELSETIKCESGFDPKAVGDDGDSFGVAQIYLPAHKNITKEQALNPDWSIEWMARQFAAGKQKMWTCWREHFQSKNTVSSGNST